jgi:hypothetical protein
LINRSREIRDRLFVDDRRLSFFRLPNLRQVVAGEDRQETACRAPLKRSPQRQANRPTGWAYSRFGPPRIRGVDKPAAIRRRMIPHLEAAGHHA